LPLYDNVLAIDQIGEVLLGALAERLPLLGSVERYDQKVCK